MTHNTLPGGYIARDNWPRQRDAERAANRLRKQGHAVKVSRETPWVGVYVIYVKGE